MKTPDAFRIALAVLCLALLTGCGDRNRRQTVSLGGTWDIAATGLDAPMPVAYSSRCPVPGLVDMSEPAVAAPGRQAADTLFWYRTTFRADAAGYDVARLNILRSRYHTRVYVNGHSAGEFPYNLTASQYDLKPYLNDKGDNELVVAVGCFGNVPDSIVNGRDAEIYFYPPGLFDDVQLTLTNYPYIANLQTAPDLDRETLRVVARLETPDSLAPGMLRYQVHEVSTDKLFCSGDTHGVEPVRDGDGWKVDFTIPMSGAELWSPEHPFLYRVTVSSDGDTKSERIGMRTFRFDTPTGMAVLNGKPYYLRGTNIDLNRFYEDDLRGALPWDRQWVTKLYEGIKGNYMNAIRNTTCFPPEFWYDICDSLGFIVFDEYDIWGMVGRDEMLTQTADQLAREYAVWMRQRWNRPSVCVWDAQNETVTRQTGPAINRVRSLDLQNRPWDNGFATPAAESDCKETHPYVFIEFVYPNAKLPEEGIMKYAYARERIPENGPDQWTPDTSGKRYPNATIINEYGWLWLNRDGSTTTLTDHVYPQIFGEGLSTDQRREIYGRHLGMLTEYWRESRRNAGVLHFSSLTFSRSAGTPRSCTGDCYTDVRTLAFDPYFIRYVRPAFCPVGLMVKYFETELAPGERIDVPVSVINDTYEAYTGALRLYFRPEGTTGAVAEAVKPTDIPANGKQVLSFAVEVPSASGRYELVAEIGFEGDTIRSVRQLGIGGQAPQSAGIAERR